MPQLRCPQCGRVSTFAAGRSPVCPACGFGAPDQAGGRAGPPGPATRAAPSASARPSAQSPPAQSFPAQSPLHPSASPYPRRTDGGAVAALVLGIIGLVVPFIGLVTSIIAWVMGANAMKRCDADPYLEGRGMAQAGLIMGIVGVALWALVLLFYLFVFGILFSAGAW